jgi:S-adenosylmethionine/arginine decarboxylase-like enzyme
MSYHKVKETDPPIELMSYANFYHQIIREHQFALAAVRTLQAEQHIYVDEMGTTHARPLGQHLLAEFRVNPACLQGQQLKDIIYQAAKVSGATILKSAAFDFHPISDASGIVVIEESHFIYHYLPEYQLLSFDAFTCGDINFRAAINHMQAEVQATPYDTLAWHSYLRRGAFCGWYCLTRRCCKVYVL